VKEQWKGNLKTVDFTVEEKNKERPKTNTKKKSEKQIITNESTETNNTSIMGMNNSNVHSCEVLEKAENNEKKITNKRSIASPPHCTRQFLHYFFENGIERLTTRHNEI
jgi:hypothetical protein